MVFQNDSKKTIRLGVISDTHVPDRVGELHPDVLRIFVENHVDQIVHAGDASSMQVIRSLESVAPVIHVSGNRDFLMRKENQLVLYLTINGVKFGVTHGHGGFLPYFLDKFPYMLEGYKFERYQKKLDKIVGDVNVVIFGHTHTSENRWVNGRLFFNSGSAYDRGKDRRGPSVGLITVDPQGQVKSSIISLEFMKWGNGKWEKQTKSPFKRFKS
ncbi:MAG: hypothetical protein CL609_05265 [Anaerolineaceae bacterium]|nr:hypothetical protein [Anaerolineaceae bacterium]